MNNATGAGYGRVSLRALLFAIVCTLLSACAVRGIEVQPAASGATKVDKRQVKVERRVVPGDELQTPSNEPLASPTNIARAQQNIKNLFERLDEGFKDRFPDMAGSYGLSITPSAPTVLTVRLISTTSICTHDILLPNNCGTIFELQGTVADQRGTPMWTLKGTVEVHSGDKTGELFYKNTFPTFAQKWLEAMKKQGMIG